jgi:hypothetical protein
MFVDAKASSGTAAMMTSASISRSTRATLKEREVTGDEPAHATQLTLS